MIYLLPLGNIENELLHIIGQNIRELFKHEFKVLSVLEVPESAYDDKRSQYMATTLLKEVIKNAPDNAIRIIGITPVDLFLPVLTFVFGQAQLNGKAAVVSTCRLKQEFYGLPPSQRLFRERVCKEVTHELGHTYGMVHCMNKKCVMHFSNSIRQVDIKDNCFCHGCIRKLQENKNERNSPNFSGG
ncbi:archaemetzincin family Zn-dependent metalloprotease [bacterium]|nr:archaemetzincin family Zn-dependent metalloprotease [bacterium]